LGLNVALTPHWLRPLITGQQSQFALTISGTTSFYGYCTALYREKGTPE
jgi:hypothetical protein